MDMNEVNPEDEDFGSRIENEFGEPETDNPYADMDHDPDALDDPDEVKPEPEAVEPEPEPEDVIDDPDEDEAEEVDETEEVVEDEVEEPEGDSDKPGGEFDAETLKIWEEMQNSPHGGAAFQKVRAQLKETRQELESLREGAAELPEVVELKAKAERLSHVETELEQAKNQLALHDFRTTPDYQKAVVAPYTAIAADAKTISETHSIPEGSIMAAVSIDDRARQDSAISEIVNEFGLSRRDEMTLYEMANGVGSIKAREAEMSKDAQSRLQEHSEQEAQRQAYMKEQERASYRSNLRNVFKEYETAIPAFIGEDGEVKPEYTEAMKSVEDLDFKDTELQALSAYALSVSPVLAKENQELASEVSKLNALLSRHRSVSPSKPTSASGGKQTKSSGNAKRGMSISDSLGARMREAGII